MRILLTKDEILDAYASEETAEFLSGSEGIAKAQFKKVADFLREKTIGAYGGNRIILDEDWQALQKEVNDVPNGWRDNNLVGEGSIYG